MIFAVNDRTPHGKIDPFSETWRGVVAYIKQEVETTHLPDLRAVGSDHSATQYARGAIDALEALLELGENR